MVHVHYWNVLDILSETVDYNPTYYVVGNIKGAKSEQSLKYVPQLPNRKLVSKWLAHLLILIKVTLVLNRKHSLLCIPRVFESSSHYLRSLFYGRGHRGIAQESDMPLQCVLHRERGDQ